jgi:hypothetical protein
MLLFLQHSRQALRKTMIQHCIDLTLHEALFNHTILHAVDHCATYAAIHRYRYSPNPFAGEGRAGAWAAFRMQVRVGGECSTDTCHIDVFSWCCVTFCGV